MLDKLNLTTTILLFSPFSQYLLFPEQIKIKTRSKEALKITLY